MDQEVGHQPLTTETWVNFHVSQCRLCGGQSGRFHPLPVLPVSSVNILPMLHTCISYNYHQCYTVLANDNAVKQNTSRFSLDLCCYFVLELYKLRATRYLGNNIIHSALHAFYDQGVNNSVG
jgi:hypothetical protein